MTIEMPADDHQAIYGVQLYLLFDVKLFVSKQRKAGGFQNLIGTNISDPSIHCPSLTRGFSFYHSGKPLYSCPFFNNDQSVACISN